MRKDDNGYIVVETIGSFILFVFLMFSILTLVNIVTLQARVHSAITQTANVISKYSFISHLSEEEGAAVETMRNVAGWLEVLRGGGGDDDDDDGGDVVDGLELIAADNDSLRDQIPILVERFLSIQDMGGDRYLISVNVIGGLAGLDFDESVLLDDEGNVRIVVNYRIEYSFGALPLPFPDLRVTQTALTRAWVGGNGDGLRE